MIYKAEEITKLLTKAGLHLDAVNCEGATAARICSSRKMINVFRVLISNAKNLFVTEQLEQFIKKLEIKATTLKCLASRAIAQHKISYRSIVPVHLEKFIQLHSANKSALT